MPLNYHDTTPAEQPLMQDYVSQYIPVPFGEMAMAGNAIQKRADESELERARLAKLLQVNARPEDVDRLNTLVGSYNQRLMDVANKVSSDPASIEYKRALNEISGDLANDLSGGKLYAVKKNYENYEAWKKLQAERKDYQKYNDEAYLTIAPGFYRGAFDENGKINIASPANVHEYVDEVKAADELVKGIGAENWQTGWGIKYKDGNAYIVDSKGKHITDKKIGAAFEMFKNSPAYAQIQRRARYSKDPSAYTEQEFNRLLTGVQNKYRESELDVNAKADDYALAGFKDQIENPNVRFEMYGISMNPGTREKSFEDAQANINTFVSQNQNLEKYLTENPDLSQEEKSRVGGQMAFNKAIIKRKQSMLAQGAKEIAAKQFTKEDQEFIKRIGLTPEQVAGNSLPLEFNSASRSQWRAYTEDGRRLNKLLGNAKGDLDKWLEENSDKYGVQPKLITLDPAPNKPTVSKAIEELYNKGLGSWQVFDENGQILDDETIQELGELSIKQITTGPVDELGFMFGGVKEEKDDKGNVVGRKHYYVKPTNDDHNVTEKVGLDLVKENSPRTTEGMKNRYQMGVDMLTNKYLPQISQLKIGESVPIVMGGQTGPEVSKVETAAGPKYLVNGDTNYPFNSDREVANYFVALQLKNQKN